MAQASSPIPDPDLEAQNAGPLPSGEKDPEKPINQASVEVDGPLPESHTPPPSGDMHKNHDTEEYDERAANFWSVYVGEAESHDKALVETWKDDMEGIIIFAGLYSASLTAFLTESYKLLVPNPMQDNVYYTRQSVQLLAQISAQLAASGSPVPSTVNLPPPLEDFRAEKSDVRVNIYWFMSLVFSLTAALAATLVQQWVRDYMHVFQRYNHALKRSRIRQFLYEGTQRWYMPVVVDAVPALIHISLFLFFVGLADFLFKINTSTATATTVTIGVAISFYLWTIIAPVQDAQSPYQSPLSAVFWLLVQLIRRRKHKPHGTDGEWKKVSTNMTEGRIQLAMHESKERKKRDANAIRWVIDNLTEDSELEPFVLGIPGSFGSTWGQKVWETVAEGEGQNESALVLHNHGPPTQAVATTGSTQRKDSLHLHDLCSRITRLLKTCADPGILPTEDDRRKQSEILAQTLRYLGAIESNRAEATQGFDSTTVVRRTCMSIIAVRKMLQTSAVHDAAQHVISRLAAVQGETESDKDVLAAQTVGTIDQYMKSAWDSALNLHDELTPEVELDKMEERLHEIMRSNKGQIAELEYTWNILGWAKEVDDKVISLVETMMNATGGVLYYLPHTVLEWQDDPRRIPDEGMRPIPTYLMPQLIPPRLLMQRLWVCPWLFRSISASGWDYAVYQPKTLGELSAPELSVNELCELMNTQTPIKTQLCRMQDLRDGGLVYVVELFITAVRSNKAASQHSSRSLFVGTFHSITADWKEYPCAIWTQELLVNLLRQVLQQSDVPPADEVPGYIIDEFLSFVANVLAEKKGPHVDEAISIIEGYIHSRGGPQEIARKAISTIAPPDQPPGGLPTGTL
ncbi:hypothetical protein F5148DRAFT_1200689 [Russula earlei]|uniref:Uncharacterized protein n=1 Tax=Russula earlei TaxID=71964 RepID=A0ACC0U8A6_9AGAM|nr:hypothetical protein F5148DRAFT_1200689 [Russula earlei]